MPCPIQPLGHLGGRCYLLDATGQVLSFVARDLTYAHLTYVAGMPPLGKGPDGSLWPIHAWLIQEAAAYDKDGKATGDFSAKKAASLITAMCRRVGVYNPNTPHRTAGVWPGQDGERTGTLMVHFGDQVEIWKHGRAVGEEPVGFKDAGALYLAAPKLPRAPDAKPFTAEQARHLVTCLELWGWRDPIMVDLMAGLIAAGFYGAAPPWRVHGAVAAPAATGKTELARFAAAVLGPLGFYSNDFTEAHIRQTLNGKGAVLVLDESESDPQGGPSPAAKAVALLRRLSGEEGLRGGRGSPQGQAQTFTLSGTGLIFGITIPPMEAADRSRFITFALQKPRGTIAELSKAKAWAATACDPLRLRMLGKWDVFRSAFATFGQALELDFGLQGRPVNVFGIVLAARWLLEHDDPPSLEAAGEWVARVGGAIGRHQDDTEATDCSACMGKLLTSTVRAFRQGEEFTIGELIARGIGSVTEPRREDGSLGALKPKALGTAPPALALRRHGLRLEIVDRALYVAIAHSHETLRKIFAGSRWQGGGWRESLLNWPTARLSAGALRFIGAQVRAVMVDVVTLEFESVDDGPKEQHSGGGSTDPPK